MDPIHPRKYGVLDETIIRSIAMVYMFINDKEEWIIITDSSIIPEEKLMVVLMDLKLDQRYTVQH